MTATGGPDFFGLFPQGASTVEEEEDVVLEDVDNNKESPAEDSPRVPSPVDVDVAMGEAVSPVETQQSEEPVPSVGDLMKRMRSSKDPLKDVFSTLLWDERSLAALETGSFANEFVLPLYLETKTVSDETLFSLVILMNQKARAEGTLSSAEALLNADPNKFSKTVGRILKAFLDPPSIVSPAHRLSLKREILIFLCSLFSSLHLPALRAEALKLVGIGAWTTLVSDTARARLFQAAPELQDLWSRSEDKFKDIEKKSTKERISFERSFLSRAIGDFLTVIEGDQDSATTDIPAVASYVEWFLEFLIVLVSQLPTRRFSHALMEDHLVLVQIERSDYYKKARSRADAMTKKQQQLSVLSLREASKAGLVFLEQTQRLRLYLLGFGIDNRTGLPMSSTEVTHVQHSRLRSIQKLCFEHFRDDAADLALTNVGALATPGVLRDYLQDLSLKSLVFLSKELGIRSRPHHKKGHPDSKEFILDVFVRTFEELPQNERDLNALQASPVYPTELSLSQTLNYAASASSIGSLCYPIPKLHGQFLSSKDYACRSYELLRLEATESLRQDVLDVSKRLSPRLNPVTDGSSAEKTVFGGWASMGAPVSSCKITEVGEPSLGLKQPSHVKARIQLSLAQFPVEIAKDWDALTTKTVVYLLSFDASDAKRPFGLKSIRGGQIHAWIGANGKPIASGSNADRSTGSLMSQRTLDLLLDPAQHWSDSKAKQLGSFYGSFNILLRQSPTQTSRLHQMALLKTLMKRDMFLPAWLQDVFLGYGNPQSVNPGSLTNFPYKVDIRDTFVDAKHVQESFPELESQLKKSAGPPFVLEFVSEITHADMEENPSSRKRKSPEDNNVVVTSYTQANRGPYPQDIAKKNSTRFTPDQVSALVAASTSGVTIVSGPTGSGKTKTASQIISNLYHSQERVFVVSPDSQMLSRLFAHILDLDVDLSDVVWLGNEAETEKSPVNCSVTGRVNDFLQQRLFLLGKVETLARSLEQPPGHGYTCETAGYFFKSIIQPKWENFLRLAKSEDTVKSNFPFSGFFSDAPNPVFSDKMSFEAALEAATGCYQHIQKLFGKLEKMRAFEILKSDMDRGNYILKKVSKIIAITISSLCTMYEDLLSLGLNFESAVVMDAQHLRDVQSLTPLCLQTLSSNSGSSVLKRAILFGDRNQLQGTSGGLNCLQNAALNQSLFERLIKTGVSSNDLFCQFTARPSLVKLYESWYGGNLKTVADQFQEANPGFCFDYQFVDVPDYGGQGELEPRSGFLQNLGEAEYSVALYQYMRLIGYPSDKITILTPFNGQRELILDVLQRRCSWHPFFGSPKGVFNIDEYHCDQNDIVILSLVRTKAYDGILRDRRTWISALSKARRGVYVVGRHSLFKQAWSVQSIVDQMETRPVSGLWLQTGESYEQCARASGDSGIKLNSKTQKWDKAKDSAVQEIKSLAELGALVQTLTQNKVALMKAQKQRQA